MSAGSLLPQITKISDRGCRPQSAAAATDLLSCTQKFPRVLNRPPFILSWIYRCARCLPVRVFPPDPRSNSGGSGDLLSGCLFFLLGLWQVVGQVCRRTSSEDHGGQKSWRLAPCLLPDVCTVLALLRSFFCVFPSTMC